MFSRIRLGPREGGQHSYTGKMCYTFHTLRFCLKQILCILLFTKRDEKIISFKSEKSECVRLNSSSISNILAGHFELSRTFVSFARSTDFSQIR